MKKIVVLLLVAVLTLSFASGTFAQSKIIRKNVRKVIKPEIAPEPAPNIETTEEAMPMPEPPSPPSPFSELKEGSGLFGWNTRVEANGSYAYNSGQSGFLGLVGGGLNLIFA
ncbi:MAG: hypothetical protein KJ811_03750, partial [Candidatus Margulisbacteria bacterium]|nr:hypothetical protein [Candidatus Margulisiibacteriota bacterium]